MSLEASERYLKHLEYERELAESELTNNAALLESFTNHCNTIGVALKREDFYYLTKVGIVAVKAGLLSHLVPGLQADKEGLLDFTQLEKFLNIKFFKPGEFHASNFIALPNQYFRREFHPDQSFAPRFIENFWRVDDPKIRKAIALDPDRVRIDITDLDTLELDTWYGAHFKQDIKAISDGAVHLRPPGDITPGFIKLLFYSNHSLDIHWKTVEIEGTTCKIFEAEEFKNEDITVEVAGDERHPVRYIHAVYDIEKGHFNHFDGAVHLYTHDDYFARRSGDFNYNKKNNKQIKADSIKLFKLDGEIKAATWVDLCCHFCSQNELILEYFQGRYSDRTVDYLDAIRNAPEDEDVDDIESLES